MNPLASGVSLRKLNVTIYTGFIHLRTTTNTVSVYIKSISLTERRRRRHMRGRAVYTICFFPPLPLSKLPRGLSYSPPSLLIQGLPFVSAQHRFEHLCRFIFGSLRFRSNLAVTLKQSTKAPLLFQGKIVKTTAKKGALQDNLRVRLGST